MNLMLILLIYFVLGSIIIRNPEYVVSPKGKFMLCHNGFYYSLVKRTQMGDYEKSTWRCSNKGTKIRKGCRATVSCIERGDTIEAIFKSQHSHTPQSLKK